MEIKTFISYCASIGALERDCRGRLRDETIDRAQWAANARSLAGDYLSGACSYGYARAMKNLFAPTYSAISAEAKKPGFDIEAIDLWELSATVMNDDAHGEYSIYACYFSICVAASGIFGKKIEDGEIAKFDENELSGFCCPRLTRDGVGSIEEKIDGFGKRLLDFSRSNQLVNFRPSKSSALRLLCPDIERGVARLIGGDKIYLSGWKKIDPKP